MQRLWVLLFLMAFASPATAGDLASGVSQRVVRLNVTRGEGIQPRTLVDCFDSEGCLIHLTQALNQTGGNPGLLKRGETAVAQVEGLRHHFDFVPAAGEYFCAAEFLTPSMAPTFQSRAPEVWLQISAREMTIDVVLPGNAPASWVDGFIILYGAKPGAERTCTLTQETVRYSCKGRCGAKGF